MRVLALLLGLAIGGTAGAVPLTTTHSGRLVDAEGAPVNGTQDVTVTLYDSTGIAWTSTFTSVPIVNGYYSVVLGSTTPLSADVFDDDIMEVGIRVGTSPEMARQPLTSAPFALRAHTVHGRVQLVDEGPCSTSEHAGSLRWSGDNVEVCDGADWRAISGTGGGNGADQQHPGITCATIHANFPSLTSGPYWIDPDGDSDTSDAFEAYCEMTVNGGGWTRCLAARYFPSAKPDGWTKSTWVSGLWSTGSSVLSGDYTGSNYGNFCSRLTGQVNEMYGGVTYNPGFGFPNFNTAPIPFNSTLLNPGGNGTFTAGGQSIGIDSSQRGIYGADCNTVYTTNTYQNMQSLCFEDGTGRYQAQHTGWTCGQTTNCTDSCNQPCYCGQSTYCGGANPYERDIVMSLYLR